MTMIGDVYAAMQHSAHPLTLANLVNAVEDQTGQRPQRDQVCQAASQLTREGFAVRVRNGVYRAARQPIHGSNGAGSNGAGSNGAGSNGAGIDHHLPAQVIVSAEQPSTCEACNLSHADVLKLLFGPRFEPNADQVPLVRELTHAIDGLNQSIRDTATR